MAIIKRYNPNRFFFPGRLTEKLNTILKNKLTVIEAPTGFGKTTSVRNLLNYAEEPFLWINIDNESKSDFFEEFCNDFQAIDDGAVNKLRAVGCPSDQESCNKIINIICEAEIEEEFIIVFDNYQYISDEWISNMIVELADTLELNLRFIIITQSIKTSVILEMVSGFRLNYIGKSDLEFTREEIQMYFRDCGVKLDTGQVEYLYKYTEGWISALYLQLLHYINHNEFEPDADIDKLVCKAIWDKLTMDEQDFLICISIYDSFSLKQAQYIGQEALDPELIKKLLNENAFIRYDSRDRKYYTHAILRYFLKAEFDKLDHIYKKRVYEKAAKWYADNEIYYSSLKYYYYIKSYENIYDLNVSLDEMLPYVNRENKDMFMNIIYHTPLEAKERNIRRSLVFGFLLFLYNEKDFFQTECKTIYDLILNSSRLKEREREMLSGELKFVYAFSKYNDLSEFHKLCEEAYSHMKAPTTIYPQKLSLTFRNPSVLACFHKSCGKAFEELELLEKTMVTYYKITSGNSKGLEALMRAEILFYNGEFNDSQVLCQKALYMAETRNQVNVYICTMFLLARISVFQGDYENMKDILNSIRKKIAHTGEIEESFTADLCEGYLYMFLGKMDDLPGWLKSVHMIEEKCTVLTLGFANLVYAKNLLVKEEYSKFLGISGQMLGVSRVYGNILYEIYTYIYISIANYNLRNTAKAKKFIFEALELSLEDYFIMPFVENFDAIADILCMDIITPENKKFISKIHSTYKKYEKDFKIVQNAYRNDMDYGLTKRELQVAKLAAKRFTNKEIAEELYIAESTVKSNLKTIFSKLQVKSRSELKNYF